MYDRTLDRQAAAKWAHDLLQRGKFVILDTETTGFSNSAQICQLAVLQADGETFVQWLIQPTVEIDPAAQAVHGISKADLSGYGGFDQYLIPLFQSLGSSDLIIFNADYDLRLLQQSARAYGIWLAFPTSDRRKCRIFSNGGSIHCAMNWYSQFIGEWSEWHQNYKWQKLPGGDHSAIGDCRAVLNLIRLMADSYKPTSSDRSDIIF